jgi:hypothetical protein
MIIIIITIITLRIQSYKIKVKKSLKKKGSHKTTKLTFKLLNPNKLIITSEKVLI